VATGFRIKDLASYIAEIPEDQLVLLRDVLAEWVSFWFLPPTSETFEALRESHPLIPEIFNFEIVVPRAISAKPSEYGLAPPIKESFPELKELLILLEDRISSLPSGPDKAARRLWAAAQLAGADADVEAATFCASRGLTSTGLELSFGLGWTNRRGGLYLANSV
jgi:hypothetical protein